MLSLTQQLKQSHYRGANRYLTEMDFGMMLILAGVLHLLGIGIYYLMPERKADEIPVKVLNVRLGVDSGVSTDPYGFGATPPPATVEETQKSADAVNPKAPMTPLEAALAEKEGAAKETKAKQTEAQRLERKRKARAGGGAGDEAAKLLVNNGPVRYIRRAGQWGHGTEGETGQPGGSGDTKGFPLGNSQAADAEALSRYTQRISLAISLNKFYPEEARSQGRPQGEAKVLIRVNQDGKIVGFRIQESSGHKILDRAIPVILNRSNPLPRNPKFSSTRGYEEFIVAIAFTKQ